MFYIIICCGVVSAEALRLFLRPLRCLCGASAVVSAASAVPLRLFLPPLRRLCGFMLELYFTSRSTSILHPVRSQFYVQFDLNFTSRSTSILRPIRSQFYVQFDLDLNFTSNSTSILDPIRRDMKLPLATVGFKSYCRRRKGKWRGPGEERRLHRRLSVHSH